MLQFVAMRPPIWGHSTFTMALGPIDFGWERHLSQIAHAWDGRHVRYWPSAESAFVCFILSLQYTNPELLHFFCKQKGLRGYLATVAGKQHPLHRREEVVVLVLVHNVEPGRVEESPQSAAWFARESILR